MADIRLKPTTLTPGAGSLTNFVPLKGYLDGTMFTAEWLARMALEGRMYSFNGGTGTAPQTFKGAYVNTTPDMDISVPAGVMVIPINVDIYYEAFGSNSISEVSIAIGGLGAVATGGTALTPKNHRIDVGDATGGVTCMAAGATATYMTKNVVELYHNGQQTAITKTTASATASVSDPNFFNWNAFTSGKWAAIYDPSGITRMNVFAASQAGTGFINVTFVVPPLTVIA